MKWSDLITEGIFPLVMCTLLGIAGIVGAIFAGRTKKFVDHSGKFVKAKVIGYAFVWEKRNGRNRRYREITVECVPPPPSSGEPVHYIISTDSRGTFVYRWRKEVKVCFIEKDKPLLPEDTEQTGFDSTAGFVAGGIMLFFALILLVMILLRK